MVEIMAIIRPNKTSETKKALIEINHPGYTCIKAIGRGKKSIEMILNDGTSILTKLVTKRIFLIVVEDQYKDEVIDTIMKVNCTSNPGDGKIFVSQVNDSYNVREYKGESI